MAAATVLDAECGDILDAISAAGDGGTVYFPKRDYLLPDGIVTTCNQRWEGEIGARLIGPGNLDVITLGAPLEIHGLTIDGARIGEPIPGTSSAPRGIYADTHTLIMEGGSIVNVEGWGILSLNNKFRARDIEFYNTGLAAILWKSMLDRIDGPLVEGCLVDRSTGYGTPVTGGYGYGGILLINDDVAGHIVRAPRAINNTIKLPKIANASQDTTTHQSAVCLEMRGCSGAVAMGNRTEFGHIGISFAKSQSGFMGGNSVSTAFAYGLEIAGGSNFNTASGNQVLSVSGYSAGSANPSRAVSISANSDDNLIYCTGINACSVGVGINSDCLRNVVK